MPARRPRRGAGRQALARARALPCASRAQGSCTRRSTPATSGRARVFLRRARRGAASSCAKTSATRRSRRWGEATVLTLDELSARRCRVRRPFATFERAPDDLAAIPTRRARRLLEGRDDRPPQPRHQRHGARRVVGTSRAPTCCCTRCPSTTCGLFVATHCALLLGRADAVAASSTRRVIRCCRMRR